MAHSVTEIFLQVQNWLEEKMLLSNELRAWRLITLMQSLGERGRARPAPLTAARLGTAAGRQAAMLRALEGAAGFEPL